MPGEATTSNVLGQSLEGMSGWETASPPPDTPVAAFHEEEEATMPDQVVVSDEEKKLVQVDSTADVEGVQVKENVASWAEEVKDDKTGDTPAEDIPSAHIFPIAMQDIRFTREDTRPLEPSSLPIPFRMDAAFTPSLNVEDSPLDMSTIAYLFGTFEGLRKSQPDAETQTEPEEIVERPLEDTLPLQPTSSGTPPEPEVTEQPESPSLQTEEGTNEGRSPLQRPSVDLLPATVDAASPSPQTEPAADFRLDAETQALDVEVPQPPAEQPSFIATSNPAVKEETSTSVHSHLVTTDAPRSDKPFVNAITSQTKPSQQLTTLEDPPEFVKPYGEGFGVPVENPKTEEIGNFEESRPPHRPSPNLPESKPVLETDSSFGISSGPAPTLPSYQPQRHPPPHKLQEKSVPSVGAGVTGHPPNTKYNPHASGGGVPPPGPNQNPAIHVPSSLNPTNSGNSSVPMMQQAPFLNPGMMPNPAIPFPTGTPYYPQFMQYQHQMYHGLYAGTYGGFGAPFNHESVGHPAHASPVGESSKKQDHVRSAGVWYLGVPPNQGNQPFTVSFPTSVCPLGNTVYDTANPSSFVNNKEKDVFLNQQQQQLSHAGFPGGPQPVVPRNDGGMFYGVPGQAFSQGFRNQFHQPPGFGQFPGAGFVAPPHTYHPPGQQGTPNFRLH